MSNVFFRLFAWGATGHIIIPVKPHLAFGVGAFAMRLRFRQSYIVTDGALTAHAKATDAIDARFGCKGVIHKSSGFVDMPSAVDAFLGIHFHPFS